MAFLVVELQQNSTGGLTYLATSENNRDKAESKYHEILQFAAVSTIPVHSAVLLSEEGFLIKRECYKHEQ